MITCDIQYEVTDTFGGEANYSWVKRGTIKGDPGAEFSDLAVVRRVKKAIGWNGVKCKTEHDSEGLTIRPTGMNQVCFVSFYEYGRAS